MNNYIELLQHLDDTQPSVNESIQNSVLITYLSNVENNPESMSEDQVCNLIKHARKLELVNSEIGQRVNFENGHFKTIYLGTKLTSDMIKRTVFSKCVEKKKKKKVVTCSQDNQSTTIFSYEGHSSISDDFLRKINAISEIISVDWKSAEMYEWLQSVLRVLTLSDTARITTLELDLAQQVIIEVFTGHYPIYNTLLDCVSNLNDLATTLHCGVILKLCCKLSPLLAVKLLHYLDSDAKIKSFFFIKNREMFLRYKFPLAYTYGSNLKSFVVEYKSLVFSSSFISVAALGLLYPRSFLVIPRNETQIEPFVEAFAKTMDIVRINASLIVFKLSQTFGSLAVAAFSGFRQTLVESAINLLEECKNLSLTKYRFPRFR